MEDEFWELPTCSGAQKKPGWAGGGHSGRASLGNKRRQGPASLRPSGQPPGLRASLLWPAEAEPWNLSGRRHFWARLAHVVLRLLPPLLAGRRRTSDASASSPALLGW